VTALALFLALVPLAYVWGSLPWGFLVAWVRKGVDVREYGSGKIGMTNVIRTAGVPAGLLVLLLDLGQGAAPPLLAGFLAGRLDLSADAKSYLQAACALSALVGPNWPAFLRFQGGRGTAAGLGALAVLSPWAALVALALAVPTIGLFRYVSLGSIVGAGGGSLTALVLGLAGVQTLASGLYGVLAGTLVILQHRDNIRRLLQGTEHRLGQPGHRLVRTPAQQGKG
jgi:glycerol-3-phosphate acyltransferase PlsY